MTPRPLPSGQARGGRGTPSLGWSLQRGAGGGVCSSAFGFTSDRVVNGDGAGSEAERESCRLPADWPRWRGDIALTRPWHRKLSNMSLQGSAHPTLARAGEGSEAMRCGRQCSRWCKK